MESAGSSRRGKRKRSSQSRQNRRQNNLRHEEESVNEEQNDSWEGVPESIRHQIEKVTKKLVRDYDNDSDHPLLSQWQNVFAKRLDLPHVPMKDFAECLSTRKDMIEESLQALAIEKFHQTERAKRVFHLLDTAGKGCVVGNDVLCAIQELGGIANGAGDDDIQPEQVQEMMQEFCSAEDDDLLTMDDIIRIARIVNL